jgi:hypothetical protein
MSYWGNTYMPMIDSLVDQFAKSWVEQVGKDIGHDWPPYMGSECDDDTVLDYIRRVVDDYREDFEQYAPGGYGEYERYLLEGLQHAITIVLEGDM